MKNCLMMGEGAESYSDENYVTLSADQWLDVVLSFRYNKELVL